MNRKPKRQILFNFEDRLAGQLGFVIVPYLWGPMRDKITKLLWHLLWDGVGQKLESRLYERI